MKNKLVREWISKAEEDFEAARTLVKKRKKIVPNVICFHCQQCIEKYLKAFLTKNDIEPPPIHDLQRLNNLCIKVSNEFELFKNDLDVLNAYSVDFRYPGEGATLKESKKTFKIAEEIRKVLRNKLANF